MPDLCINSVKDIKVQMHLSPSGVSHHHSTIQEVN